MPPTTPQRPRIAFLAGDCHFPRKRGARCFTSDQRGIRDLVRSIKQHAIDEVVMLVRWLGHSGFYAVKNACRVHGVRCRIVTGGGSMARREHGHD